MAAAAAQPAAAHEVADSGPPPGNEAALAAESVARVTPRAIARRDFAHWLRVYLAVEGGDTPSKGSRRHERFRRETINFLISAEWLGLEAPEHGVRVSKKAVRKSFERQKRRAFGDDEDAYRRFLKRTKRTERDLLLQVRLSLLANRLERHATKGADTRAARREALEDFAAAFRRKWRARTGCAARYKTRHCGRTLPRAAGDSR